VMQLYRRPIDAVRLSVEPQLASWDASGQVSQVRLARFLTDLESVAGPMMAAQRGRLAVELIVGLPSTTELTAGGRDLDNYLYPVARRLDATRFAAVFGRKTHGPSWLAMGPAEPDMAAAPPQFTTRMAGSYERKEWKVTLRDRLLEAPVIPAEPGPVEMDIAMTTGPGRNWANVWKPLLDAFGPVLGEDPVRPFCPRDDRIISLGLHHSVATDIGHDVIVEAWWTNGGTTH